MIIAYKKLSKINYYGLFLIFKLDCQLVQFSQSGFYRKNEKKKKKIQFFNRIMH